MNGPIIIAKKEFVTSFKDNVFLVMAALFLVMSIASVYIGSTTKNAELRAYDNIVQEAKLQGSAIPDKPQIYPLSILHNIVEYIIMIGAVLAIFLGFDAFGSERENGTLRILLSRPITRSGFLLGKLMGAGLIIGVLLGATFVFNISLFVFSAGLFPDGNEIMRLLIFTAVSFLYMMIFYTASLFVSIKSRDRAYGFLIMMIIWIFISFVIPQLADSQRNFAYALNNISAAVMQIPSETPISKLIEFFSPAVQFQNLGNDLLQATSDSATISIGKVLGNNVLGLFHIFVLTGILLGISFAAVKKENVL